MTKISSYSQLQQVDLTQILSYNCDAKSNCTFGIQQTLIQDEKKWEQFLTGCAPFSLNTQVTGTYHCNPHVCKNAPGSFICECPTGTVYNNNTETCDDIDECFDLPSRQGCLYHLESVSFMHFDPEKSLFLIIN